MNANALFIDGHKARVKYDPVIGMFRGEFLNTNHKATFIAGDVKELKIAARDVYDCYCQNCQASGIEPFGEKKLLPLVCTLLKRIIH